MSSVFLTNVDDYLAPSQACINPLFADDNNKKNKKKDTTEEPKQQNVVKTTTRRVVRRRTNNQAPAVTTPAIPKRPTETSAKEEFSLADCLACSGCVTTAETVLMEQHSLSTLHTKCQEAVANKLPVFVTISPASLADLMRCLQIDSHYQTWFRRLASFLHQAVHATVVLDGNVPLGYSLREAAREFCHAYRHQHAEEDEDAMDIDDNIDEDDVIPADTPSIALSSTQTQYILPNGETRVVTRKAGFNNSQDLPLISSSCPALVCLVEKSVAGAVQHLASTKSPMAVAGALLKNFQKSSLHVGIMPCHDKKLEALRKDLDQDVDLVITTREWLDLLQQHATRTNERASPLEIRTYLESLPLSPVQPSMMFNEHLRPVLVSEMACSTEMTFPANADEAFSSTFYPFGSGGYADYIFRYAAKELFGYTVTEVPWKPVVSQRRARVQSARVSAAQKRNVDFFQVALYQHADGTYSCDTPANNNNSQRVPLLNFCTAYGLQNIQRVLQPFKKSKTVSAAAAATVGKSAYHYVEAMACPSGCLNGGGQARTVQRETPSETRQRVKETRQVMVRQARSGITTKIQQQQGDDGNMALFEKEQDLLHTRFHIVPQMQTNGNSSSGMIVNTKW